MTSSAAAFLLYGAVPFAILAILYFGTPQLSEGGKMIYAYATYIALSVCYTFVNVPYGALNSAMTRDQHESVSITTYRTFLANTGQVVVAFCVPLLAGQFSKTMGIGQSWQLTMAIIAIIGGILYIKPNYILSNKHYNKMFIAFCNYSIINCKVMKDLI